MSLDTLPIDIHCSKLLDWLISRRHCNKDFQQAINVVRAKIINAIQDMPENEAIQALLSGTQLNYFACVKIVEILKETEADSKNIFGFYSSQRMKDWKEIVKLYEKDNVYLAECAQILMRNVNYEVPSLKKQLNKLRSLQEEYLKKREDCEKQANKYRNEYQAGIQKMGIEGEDVVKELKQLSSEFPSYLSTVCADLSKLKDCRDYYLEFVRFTTGNKDLDGLPLIDYLLKSGNTTFYQYRTGEEPEVIQTLEPAPDVLGELESAVDDEQIDFGDDVASTGTTSNGNGDFEHIDKAEIMQDENGISWDVTTDSADISVIEMPGAAKVAKGVDAQTILQYKVTRNAFINELVELEGFFDYRITEAMADESILSTYQFQGAPAVLQLATVDTLKSMLNTVIGFLEKLTNETAVQLCLIQDNPKYIESLKQKLEHKLELSEKALQKSGLMQDKAEEASVEHERLTPQLGLFIEKTRELQKLLEMDISKRFKNRPVNIMGGVQIL